MARYQVIEGAVATQACKDVFHTAHSAGTANGWNQARLWLESLSRSSRVTEDSTPDTQGVPQNDNPTPGETSLVELYSP
jgi:hypothetical protein